jgi:hypothetical protein
MTNEPAYACEVVVSKLASLVGTMGQWELPGLSDGGIEFRLQVDTSALQPSINGNFR